MEIVNKYLYLCLTCCAKPKKTRKEIREEWKAKQALNNPIETIESEKKVPPSPLPAKKPIIVNGVTVPEEKIPNVVKLQAVVRGLIGRAKAYRRWLELLDEANAYWGYLQYLKDEEERIRKIREQARKDFVSQYTNDVIQTALLFIDQLSEASTLIQRIWRGYSVRKKRPPKPKPKKRTVKVPKRERFSAATLRRVWARSQFEPSDSGYLHNTDFGYLEYDMFEHMNQPPEGLDVGLKNRKIKLPIRAESSEIVIMHDKHAWVGLPVGYELTADKEAWKKAKLPNNVKNMIFNSPYKNPLLTEEERDSLSPNKRSNRKSPAKKLFSPSTTTNNNKDISDELNVNNDFQEAMDAAEQELEEQKLSENDQLEFLKSIGYDDQVEKTIRLPGMPRIGTKQYDPMTGHLLVYRGNNRWKRVSDDKYVNFGLHFYNMEENLPIQKMQSIVSDDTSIMIPPKIIEEPSGVIHVTNSSITKKTSAFRRAHQRTFQEMFKTGENHPVGSTVLLTSPSKSVQFPNSSSSPSRVQTGMTTSSASVPGFSSPTTRNSTAQSVFSHKPLLTTSQIADSFLTNVADLSQVSDEGGDYLLTNTQKDVKINEKTGTPYRGTQKVPYLAQQMKALQKAKREEEWIAAGRPVKRKKNTTDANTLQSSWNGTKGSLETLNNSLIQSNPILRQQLMNMIYSTENPNELLFNSLLTDKNDLLRTVTQNSIGRVDDYELPRNFSHSTSAAARQEISQALLESKEYDADDLFSVWRRSVYQKPKEIRSRVVVWNRPTPQHYHFKYSWIPQPLVHNAVHEVFFDRSYRDVHRETKEFYREKHMTEKDHYEQMKESLISVVSPPPSPPKASIAMGVDSFVTEDNESHVSSLYSVSDDDSLIEGSYYDPETHSVVNITKGDKKKLQKKKSKSATFLSSVEDDQDHDQRYPLPQKKPKTRPTTTTTSAADEISVMSSQFSVSQASFSPMKKSKSTMSQYSQYSQDSNNQNEKGSRNQIRKVNNKKYFKRGISTNDLEEMSQEDSMDDEQSMLTGEQGESNLYPSQSVLSLRHSVSNNSITFPDFVDGFKPRELTKSRFILESSMEKVPYQNEIKSRKFRYKPIGSKYAKVNPMHPFDWR